VLAAQAAVVGMAAHGKIYFAREYQVLAIQAQITDGLADEALGFTPGVNIGIVEEVDTASDGGFDASAGFIRVQPFSEGMVSAQSDFADSETRFSQVTVFHKW
jgi:hypothetical protein